MKVMIIQTGEPVHTDGDNIRSMRLMLLSDHLVKRGHKVYVMTSLFDHTKKSFRELSNRKVHINEKLVIEFISSTGYQSNIGLKRLWDHFILSINLSSRLKKCDFIPDVVFIGFPPIETAFVASKWCNKLRIPYIVDVKDLWPDLYLDPFKLMRPLVRFLISPYFWITKKLLTSANLCTTPTNEYLHWVKKRSVRPNLNEDFTSGLSAPDPKNKLSEKDYQDAILWWNDVIGLDITRKNRICFVGSFMSVYDFTLFRDLMKNIVRLDPSFEFIICGAGPYEAQIRHTFGDAKHVKYVGWVDYPKIAALSRLSLFSAIPYRNIENFKLNIPNKVVDALSFGLPIISSIDGAIGELIKNEKIGLLLEENTIQKTAEEVMNLMGNRASHCMMSKVCLDYYKNNFSEEKVYGNIISKLEGLVYRSKKIKI